MTDASVRSEEGEPIDSDTRSSLIYRTNFLPTPARIPTPEDGNDSRIRLARWGQLVQGSPFDSTVEEELDGHVITYSMASSHLYMTIGGRTVLDGRDPPGSLLLVGPTCERRRVVYHQSFDLFKVYVPQRLLTDCIGEDLNRSTTSSLALFDAHFSSDAVIKNLVRSLVRIDDDGGPLGLCYVDSVGLAIAFQLLGRYLGRAALSPTKADRKLAEWRLRRVQDYVEAHLASSIRLQDMSQIAGLSRMHFAAQFRATAGCSPHTYLLRRRIARAQELLMIPHLAMTDVAAAVGFKNQAHFAEVFKNIVGERPKQWRAAFRE
jgi:AraC family transcriptional regulator